MSTGSHGIGNYIKIVKRNYLVSEIRIKINDDIINSSSNKSKGTWSIVRRESNFKHTIEQDLNVQLDPCNLNKFFTDKVEDILSYILSSPEINNSDYYLNK